MTEVLISVILPVFNREDTIQRAVDSVLCQTYTYFELIIVDDGSTDNTVKIVREYKDDRIRLICQKERGGANKARNVGIAYSKGNCIAFQDSDDEWLPDKLEVQISTMKEQGALACYCPYNFFENGEFQVIPSDYKDENKYGVGLCDILTRHNVIGTPTLVIDREVLGLLGDEYFDEHMTRMQDYDLVIRLIQVCRILYINRPLVNAFRTENSISKNGGALYDSAARLIEKHRDFLDIREFVETVINIKTEFNGLHDFIDGLNVLEEKVKAYHISCKDMVLEHISSIVNVQEKILLRQYRFIEKGLQNKKFSIYGAGKVGRELYKRLQKKGLLPAAFLVTECIKVEFIDDIPVLSIDQYKNRSDMVIIGVGPQTQIELMDNLIGKGYTQFCVYYYKK